MKDALLILIFKIKVLQPTIIPAGFQVSTNTDDKKEQIVFETISDQ